MIVGVPKEIVPGEQRVAAVPASVDKMVKAGMEVWVESGAGEKAHIPDGEFEKAGARIERQVESLFASADVVLKIQRPILNESFKKHEVDLMKEGAVLIAFLQPLSNLDLVKRLADRKVTAFSMDAIPRISRAQMMDALSSMSTIAGYKSVIMAAGALGRFVPMLTTAAGTISPAKVLILGVGVAGLQAIATAKRLGAVVKAFDTRPAVKEQVKSLGAEFIEMDMMPQDTEDKGGYAKELSAEAHRREQELIKKHVGESDIVITTALIPGKKAPLLITEEMVQSMKSGSVIVDLAVEQGGNCELSEPGKEAIKHGVLIMGWLNLASSMPDHASQMYSRNISNILFHLYNNQQFQLDLKDEITREALITHKGEVMHQATREALAKGG